MKPVTSLVVSIICFSFPPSADAVFSNNIHRSKRNDFTNNYGYGPFGIGPSNAGFDSFGFYKDKFYNSGLPAKYTFASYRNYYQEAVVPYGLENPTKKGFYENFNNYPTLLKHLNDKFEVLQQDRFGPYYNGVWGYADHSPDWYGK
uniref:Secreted protein n=1 Tax=Acrobeloides nanus TaxID=290746 RepID=A0A914C3P8_9BILA